MSKNPDTICVGLGGDLKHMGKETKIEAFDALKRRICSFHCLDNMVQGVKWKLFFPADDSIW